MLSWKLFAVSFWVFLIVNLAENILYYNLGKHSIRDFRLSIPTIPEIITMIVIMLGFAGIQGILITYLLP
jgi:hypothetical protein